MKKTFLLLGILGFIAAGCYDNSQEENDLPAENKKPFNLSVYPLTSEGDVTKMAAHYAELVAKDASLAIQQISMDGAILDSILVGTEGYKLIAAADLTSNAVTMFLQLWRKGVYTYYNIDSVFNSTQPGMRGKPPLCPPPDGCDLPLAKSVNPEIISDDAVKKMAEHYIDLVKKDSKIAIQQITMDGRLLRLVLYDTKGLKLIAAADTTSDEVTAIMQFWRGGKFSYWNIRDIFTPDLVGMRGKPPLCPPPDGCDLPFLPGGKLKNAKDSLSKKM